jgi:hypothetical protein
MRELYRTVRKRRGRAKYLASVRVELHDKEGNHVPAKIVFVRDRRNRSKWLALISTDIDLLETEIMGLPQNTPGYKIPSPTYGYVKIGIRFPVPLNPLGQNCNLG